MKPPYGAPGYGMDSKPMSAMGGSEAAPPWQGRSIAGPKLRLVEFSAFLEQTRDPESVSLMIKIPVFVQNCFLKAFLVLITFFLSPLLFQYHKHLFVHIGSNYSYSDPELEVSDLSNSLFK